MPERDHGPILVWNTRDPLKGRTHAEFEAGLREKLAGRVEEAWFFGSYGTPAFNRDSDVDLMLVVRNEKPFLERSRDFFDIMDLATDMDLLVYTPEEFEKLTTDPSPGFWASAVASMKRVP